MQSTDILFRLISLFSGILPFLIIIFVISRVISAVSKAASSSSGETAAAEKVHRLVSDLTTRLSTTQPAPIVETVRITPPSPGSTKLVDWDLIRENMEPEEIRACFDVDALSRGVRTEDLPKYVRIDRLRRLFSDDQLSEMLNLDFFLGAQKKPSPLLATRAIVPPSVVPLSDKPDVAEKQHDSETSGRIRANSSTTPVFSPQTLAGGVAFWQIMQTCPGIHYYSYLNQRLKESKKET